MPEERQLMALLLATAVAGLGCYVAFVVAPAKKRSRKRAQEDEEEKSAVRRRTQMYQSRIYFSV